MTTPPKRSLRLSGQTPWALGFTALAVLIFVVYQWVLPELTDPVNAQFQKWLPMSTINTILIWIVMSLGLNVVVGYAGLLDLGYVAFWAIGAYVAAWLMSTFFDQFHIHVLSPPSVSHQPGIHVTFWLVLIIAGFVCAFFGLIIGAPTLRLRSDYLALVTLGFGEIIPQFFRNGDKLFGFNLTNGDLGIGPIDQIGTGPLGQLPGVPSSLGPFDSNLKFVVYTLIAAVCIFVSLRIRSGRLGRSWLAIREDELAAGMMGVPLVRAKLSAYAVGAFFGGLGGVAYATMVGTTFPTFSFSFSITILLMVVLGGMGNVWGVTVGAVIVAWINYTGLAKVGDTVNEAFGTTINFPGYNFLVFGIILVLMMLFRREGLIPERRTQQIMREPSRTEAEQLGSEPETVEASVESEEHS